jgi:predicted transposase/invertase (TIGR01784 family)
MILFIAVLFLRAIKKSNKFTRRAMPMVITKAKNFRPLSELNLMDNFLFHEMIVDKEYGEEFCRILLKTFLNKEVRHVKIIPQKDIYGLDTDMHGIRMDAYLEAIGDGDAVDADILPDIYDIEPNLTYEKDSIPKRMRFYQGMIDAANLQRGKAYTSLPNVVIIFILPYDPFGGDRMVYTIQNMIKEDPSIDYNDGALKMILYTKGKAGNASKEMQDMLKYFESSTATNVVNSDIEFVHHMVDRIKERRETNIDYMKSWEWDEYNKKLGRDEGMIAGREEGLAVGREEGLAAGREEGIMAFIKACYKLQCSDEFHLPHRVLRIPHPGG